MKGDLLPILRQLESERNVDQKVLIDTIKAAVKSAWLKSIDHSEEVDIEMDESTLQLRVFEIKTVVDGNVGDSGEIGVDEAQAIEPDAAVGDVVRVEVTPRDFGRIAAQTAKQVIRQRIKDAEHKNIYEEFSQRIGNLVTGVVKRYARGNVIVDLGRTEAILPYREQSRLDNYRTGDRIKAFVLDVEDTARSPQVVLSRSVPDLVKELFGLEVPEIYDNTIEIRGIAREAGHRTKIAVESHDSNVDAVGACVGMKGVRVRTIMDELNGEKIDIVKWNPDDKVYISNALNPAEIRNIQIDEDNRKATVIVPQDQLSLAIGKKGQNARLAAKLTGWQIDVISQEEAEEDGLSTDERTAEDDEFDDLVSEFTELLGAEQIEVFVLVENGYDSIEAVAETDVETLAEIEGIEPERIAVLHESATSVVESAGEEEDEKEEDVSAEDAELQNAYVEMLTSLREKLELDELEAIVLVENGYDSAERIAEADVAALEAIPDMGPESASRIHKAALAVTAKNATDEGETGDDQVNEDEPVDEPDDVEANQE